MAEEKADALLVSVLDEVCWLLNIRGSDIENSPVVVAYVLVTRDEGACFYVEMSGKVVPPTVSAHLAQAGVQVKAYGDLEADLARLCEDDRKIWIDPDQCTAGLFDAMCKSIQVSRTTAEGRTVCFHCSLAHSLSPSVVACWFSNLSFRKRPQNGWERK